MSSAFTLLFHGGTPEQRTGLLPPRLQLCPAHLQLLHLVVADELSVASAGSDQLVVVTVLQDFSILQNQDVITELQKLQTDRQIDRQQRGEQT